MATAMNESCVAHIGETAGQVWHVLSEKGPLTIAKLVKEVDASARRRDASLGLAGSEEKINIEEDARTRVVSLRKEV